MASKSSASAALFLFFNLLFFAFATANEYGSPCLCNGCPCHPSPTPTIPIIPIPSTGNCPRDALKLGVCANLLDLVNVTVGSPPTLPCCSLLQGLVDLEVAVCLCTAIKGNVLGLNLDIPITLSLILNDCGRHLPNGFQCA